MRWIVLFVLVVFANASDIKASFDCTKATKEVEKYICQSHTSSKIDVKLAHTYSKFKIQDAKKLHTDFLNELNTKYVQVMDKQSLSNDLNVTKEDISAGFDANMDLYVSSEYAYKIIDVILSKRELTYDDIMLISGDNGDSVFDDYYSCDIESVNNNGVYLDIALSKNIFLYLAQKKLKDTTIKQQIDELEPLLYKWFEYLMSKKDSPRVENKLFYATDVSLMYDAFLQKLIDSDSDIKSELNKGNKKESNAELAQTKKSMLAVMEIKLTSVNQKLLDEITQKMTKLYESIYRNDKNNIILINSSLVEFFDTSISEAETNPNEG